MAKKKDLKISDDLDWLEGKVRELKEHIDSINPYTLVDRFEIVEGPKGPFHKLIAKREDVVKAYWESLRQCILLLNELDNLRNKYQEEENPKVNTRGDVKRSSLMDLKSKRAINNREV
jgi:hypothetical protein